MTDDLRTWRKSRGLKSKDVAALLGFSVEHISRVENGKRNLSRSSWRTLLALEALDKLERIA